jgi:hypothetical protein
MPAYLGPTSLALGMGSGVSLITFRTVDRACTTSDPRFVIVNAGPMAADNYYLWNYTLYERGAILTITLVRWAPRATQTARLLDLLGRPNGAIRRLSPAGWLGRKGEMHPTL